MFPNAHSEPAEAAAVWKNGKVRFWQSGHFSGSQGGACTVAFVLDGQNLSAAITDLTLSIRTLGSNGDDFGTQEMRLDAPLGGTHVNQYATATFMLEKWHGQEDGILSPLCDKGSRLLVEGAIGIQSGKTVDLIRFDQLEFSTFQKIDVKVKKAKASE
jgi:hypothetical protein